MGKKTRYWLKIRMRNLKALNQRLGYDIHIWGHERRHCFWCSNFGLSYWLFYWDGHAFVSALVLEPLAWPLVERSLKVERSLSASLDAPYEKYWWTSRAVWLPMKAPRCFLLQDSPFMRRGSRGLAFDCCLPTGRTPRCQWLPWRRTPCCLRPWIPNLFLALAKLCPLALSSCCLALAVTHGIHYISSIL